MKIVMPDGYLYAPYVYFPNKTTNGWLSTPIKRMKEPERFDDFKVSARIVEKIDVNNSSASLVVKGAPPKLLICRNGRTVWPPWVGQGLRGSTALLMSDLMFKERHAKHV